MTGPAFPRPKSRDHSKYTARKGGTVLRYSIGDLCLFRVFFDALLLHNHFDPESDLFEFPQIDPIFPDGISVISYPGAIVAKDTSRFRLRRRGFYYVLNRQPQLLYRLATNIPGLSGRIFGEDAQYPQAQGTPRLSTNGIPMLPHGGRRA